jgi:hypothetical protein
MWAIWLRALLTSYVVTSLVLACMVIAFDHHGSERNPAHRHPIASGGSALEHTHGFEVLHLHALPVAHMNERVSIAGEPGFAASASSSDAAPAFVEPAPMAATGTASFLPIGVPPSGSVAAVTLIAWALVLLAGTRSHQALFAPPLRPPSPLVR